MTTDRQDEKVERHPLREWLCHLVCHNGYDEQWVVSDGPGTLRIWTLIERRCHNGNLWYSRFWSPVDRKEDNK